MVKLTIDGQVVEVPEGSTLLDAAGELGIHVPTFCHKMGLAPYGACRICSVEVSDAAHPEGRLRASCAHPAQEGMVVRTRSDRVLKARRMIVELELGRCSTVPMLRQLADELGVERSRFGEKQEMCILCGLCVRMCSEVVGANAIGFVSRGVDRVVSTPYDEPTDACVGCGACAEVCPTGMITMEDTRGRKVLHRELSLGPNKAIRVPSLQAVPNVPFIDEESCVYFRTGACKRCATVCPKEAVDHEMQEEYEEIEVGAIMAATGFELIDVAPMLQYGYGTYDNVLTGLEFELLCHAGGPTGGKILLADGQPPEAVAILHCIGSRDENYHEYCSRVCCMYSMKFAHLVREKTGAEVYEFYIDIRAAGKGYEEFYKRMLKEDVVFIRGKAAEVTDVAQEPWEEGKLVVQAEDTLLAQVRRIPVDMVILSPALQAHADAQRVAQMLGIGCGSEGWFMERHPKLAPVQAASDGIYIAGACQSPKDIPDSVAQGAAAAANMLSLIDRGVYHVEPIVAVIDEELCGNCKTCISLCPYTAITVDEEKKIAVVESALCKGCGTCAAACPAGAAQQQGYTDRQVMAELSGALGAARSAEAVDVPTGAE